MPAFECTCRNVRGVLNPDTTGCVIHDRVARLQFERDEARDDARRHKRHGEDLAGTMDLIAAVVDHRGSKCGEDLVTTVKNIVTDRDAKHRAWARLSGADGGTRVVLECSDPDCRDRVSVCHHASKSLDENRLQLIQTHHRLCETETKLVASEKKSQEMSNEYLLLSLLENKVREMRASASIEDRLNLWSKIGETLNELTEIRSGKTF